MAAKFRNAGQACIAANRIFVHRSIYDEFAKMLVEKIESSLLCGDGFSGSATLGPLINQSGLDKVGAYVLYIYASVYTNCVLVYDKYIICECSVYLIGLYICLCIVYKVLYMSGVWRICGMYML